MNHRTIELFRLEKTFKIIESNRQPNATMPTKPCPEVPRLHVFWTPILNLWTLILGNSNSFNISKSYKVISNYIREEAVYNLDYLTWNNASMHLSYLIISCVMTWSVVLLWLLHIVVPEIKTTSIRQIPVWFNYLQGCNVFQGTRLWETERVNVSNIVVGQVLLKDKLCTARNQGEKPISSDTSNRRGRACWRVCSSLFW